MKFLEETKTTKTGAKWNILKGIRNIEMTRPERNVYEFLVECINEEHYAFPSVRYIGESLNYYDKSGTYGSVRKILNRLENKGFIRKEQFFDKIEEYDNKAYKRNHLQNNGRQGSNYYHIIPLEEREKWLKNKENKPKMTIIEKKGNDIQFEIKYPESRREKHHNTWLKLSEAQKIQLINAKIKHINENYRNNEEYDEKGNIILNQRYYQTHTEKSLFYKALKKLDIKGTKEEKEQLFNKFMEKYLYITELETLPRKLKEYVDFIKIMPFYSKKEQNNTENIKYLALFDTKKEEVVELCHENKKMAKTGEILQIKGNDNKSIPKKTKKQTKNEINKVKRPKKTKEEIRRTRRLLELIKEKETYSYSNTEYKNKRSLYQDIKEYIKNEKAIKITRFVSKNVEKHTIYFSFLPPP